MTAVETRSGDDGLSWSRDEFEEIPFSEMPRQIGRFVVLRRLGRGGMGEVYSAYDEELDRRVAIKLLRSQSPSRSRGRDTRRARMQREAQAMAKVSHPGVIQVYEVGAFMGRTFIAMEHVDGQTLEYWQQYAKRTPTEILAAYQQAGEGLAAAHRAGVLHRDFKPGNVLVDGEGRVRVMDFGLAAWLHHTRSGALVHADSGDEDTSVSDALPRLTRAGSLLGTPAFMSPEQFRGRPLDARSDQFSFCVALYEALCGGHPFGGATIEEMRRSVIEGRLREQPSARQIPARVRRVLRRGMATDPADRWPSMDALLLALRPRRRRAGWAWAGLPLLVLGVAGGIQLMQPEGPKLCEGARERVEQVWGEQRRAQVAEGFHRTGLTLAEATWRRVSAESDAYAERWIKARTRVCKATHLLGEQSAELMDRRMACLDLRLQALVSLLGAFSEADGGTVMHAVEATAQLPEVEICETVGAVVDDDREGRSLHSVALRRRLLVAQAALNVGRLESAFRGFEEIRSEAEALGLPGIAAEALERRGETERELGMIKTASSTLETAQWEALAAGHDRAAFDAALAHLEVIGTLLVDRERARTRLPEVESLLRRLGEPAALRARYLVTSGVVLGRLGDYGDALARLDEAVALTGRVHGTRHLAYAKALNASGMVALWSGDLPDARRAFRRVIELDRELLDPRHPEVTSPLNNLAIVLARQGDLVGARERFNEVLALRRSALGEQHVEVADVLMNIAGVSMELGEPRVALERTTTAREIYAASLGEGVPKTIDADLARGMAAEQLGQVETAERLFRDVLRRQREVLGSRHPDLTMVLGALGRLLTDAGQPAEGAEFLALAVELEREAIEGSGGEPELSLELTRLERSLDRAHRLVESPPALDPAAAPASGAQ